jgi:hypothetical protein
MPTHRQEQEELLLLHAAAAAISTIAQFYSLNCFLLSAVGLYYSLQKHISFLD